MATTQASEVRRCARCGEAAVVLVFEWQHSMWGRSTGASTRDYRCQACGARFSLHPNAGSITYIVVGLVLGCLVFPLAFTVLGWLRLRRDGANPVVPNAAPPRLRYRDGPPMRRCGRCDSEVALTSVTRHTHNGIPTGTDYEYHCARCDRPFVIESVWGHCFSLMSAALVGGLAVGVFAFAKHPGWRFGGGGGLALAVAVFVGQTVVRISNRFKNPVVEGLLP